MTEQQLENELAQVPLLSALTYPALRRLVQHGRLVQAPAGQIIIGPRFGTTGFFVIIQGSVAVSLPFGPILSYLGPRDIMGEIALLEGGERTAYCRSYTGCLLFEIPFGSFHSDLVADPVTRAALDQLSARRRGEQKAIREGGPPPDLTPPEKPQPVPVDAEAGSQEPQQELPKPPAVYATA